MALRSSGRWQDYDPPHSAWRLSLMGSSAPADTKQHGIPEEQIRSLVERLSKQRPWLSAQEN